MANKDSPPARSISRASVIIGTSDRNVCNLGDRARNTTVIPLNPRVLERLFHALYQIHGLLVERDAQLMRSGSDWDAKFNLRAALLRDSELLDLIAVEQDRKLVGLACAGSGQINIDVVIGVTREEVAY